MFEWIKNRLRAFLGHIPSAHGKKLHDSLRREIERNACLTAQVRMEQIEAAGPVKRLRDAEWRVFSQFGEDGIIQYLIRHVPIVNDTFIEFGVEGYEEANTRFLLVNNNWRGLIIDGSQELLDGLRLDPIYWRHELVSVNAFITAENINALFTEAGFSGDIGLLSVDIDGNDYWVWKAITAVSPRIVVCEYNSLFGNRYPVTVPYQPDFNKRTAHYSDLYFGASLPALCELAREKNYTFVGSNAQGHNAFFVRSDLVGDLPRPSVQEEYVRSRFRSSVDEKMNLTFLTGEARVDAIAEMEVEDVGTGQRRKVKDLMS